MEPNHTLGVDNGRSRPTLSIIAIAVFQIVASVFTLVMFERAVRMFYFSDLSSVPAYAPIMLSTLLGSALLEIVAAIGLLRLKNSARQMSLCIATIPLCVVAIAEALHKLHPPWDWTALVMELWLWVLIPVSVWWWTVFTRKSIRAQFR